MLDIIICFCDKDVNLIDSFIEKIKNIKLSIEYHLIFVDDRLDKSHKVSLDKDYRLVVPSEKLGTFEARRLGFNNSSSDYVWFVDIDDDLLYFKFEQFNADICVYNFLANNQQYTFYKSEKSDDLTNKQFFMRFGLWNKVFKRNLLKKVFVKIPEIKNLTYFDDTYLNIVSALFADSIEVKPDVIYNYNVINRNGYMFKDHLDTLKYVLAKCDPSLLNYLIQFFYESGLTAKDLNLTT